MSSIAQELRELLITMERETHGITRQFENTILDIASKVEREENNLTHLVSCMAATADELAERKSTPGYQINRQALLMDLASRALAGIPIWQHLSPRSFVLDRVERAKMVLAPRVKQAQQ